MATGDVLGGIAQAYWTQTEFDANPTVVLLAGQRINLLQTGLYKIGDGITELSDLFFVTPIPRVTSISSSATPTINVDSTDCYSITALNVNITVVNISGTPVDFQPLVIRIKDDGNSKNVVLGSDFFDQGGGVSFDTTISKTSLVACLYDSVKSKFGVVKIATEA